MAKCSLDTPLAHTSLSTRIVNALDNAGVSTVRQLVGMQWPEVLRIRGLGRKSKRELRIFMSEEDLKFGMLKSKAADSPRSEFALERIATALEVLVAVDVFEGLDSARANMPGCVETLKEVRDFFREARDA